MPTFFSLKGGVQGGSLKLNGPHTPSAFLFLFAHCVRASNCTRNSLRIACETNRETISLPAVNSRRSAVRRATRFPRAFPRGCRVLRTWLSSKLPYVSIGNGSTPIACMSWMFASLGCQRGVGPTSVVLSSRRLGSAAYIRKPSASLSQPNESPASPSSEPYLTAFGH